MLLLDCACCDRATTEASDRQRRRELARVRQFYGGAGAPMSTPASPDEVVAAWRGHRQRFRDWCAALDDAGWAAETRCTDWRVRDIAQHLISGVRAHLTDLDRYLCLDVTEGASVVRFSADGDGSTDIAATAGALVDVATGRASAASIDAKAHAAALLTHPARVMSQAPAPTK